MTGLRILHVLPRLTGSVKNWSGKDAPDGRSWLIDHAEALSFNALWFSPLNVTTDVIVSRNGQDVTGSLYALKDHFLLDPEFSTSDAQQDNAHLSHFTAQAQKAGLRVMGDLVFNHVARDHPLVIREDKDIQTITLTGQNIRPLHHNNTLTGITYDDATGSHDYHFKFQRTDDLALHIPGTDEESWDDVAQINYNAPEAIAFFIDGQNGEQGYWKKVIDWHLDRGFTGFRCDVAYMLPAPIWADLVQHTHNRKPGVVFMAETLGDQSRADQLEKARITVNGQSRRAFDLSMLGTYWWDFKGHWMIDENRRMQDVARFGGAGSPDNHDTPDTIAGHFMKEFAHLPEDQQRKTVSDICLRNYAVAALLCNSVYMQLGYEYCRKQVSVFKGATSYEDWQKLQQKRGVPGHPLNLTQRIKAINEFKALLGIKNAVVRLDHIGYIGAQNELIKIDCTLRHQKSGQKIGKLSIYINEKPENGPVGIKKERLWDNERQQNMERLALGRLDTKEDHICDIHEIAAYYTPFDPHKLKPPAPGPS